MAAARGRVHCRAAVRRGGAPLVRLGGAEAKADIARAEEAVNALVKRLARPVAHRCRPCRKRRARAVGLNLRLNLAKESKASVQELETTTYLT